MAETKPIFKAPEKKPFQPAPEPPPVVEVPKPTVAVSPVSKDWQPIATAPEDADARFMVRAIVMGKPISGTETVVRYRKSRKMVGRRWEPSLTIIDDKLETKLGFRPSEWKPYTPDA